jgi:hypothetical protein
LVFFKHSLFFIIHAFIWIIYDDDYERHFNERERLSATKKGKDGEKKDNEDEEDALMKNITLDDLTKLSLDSESEAAKKFGCGTTRFKTM